MAGLQLLLCKSKKRLSHTEDVAKQDSFESPSHSSLIRCPNSPAVFPDLLRLSRAICWVRRWLSLDFFLGCVRYFPWSCSCPPWKREHVLVQRTSCAVMGLGALKQSQASCCCHLSAAEHLEGSYSHGGMSEAGWRLRPAPDPERVTGWWKLPLLSIWVLLRVCLWGEELSMACPLLWGVGHPVNKPHRVQQTRNQHTTYESHLGRRERWAAHTIALLLGSVDPN